MPDLLYVLLALDVAAGFDGIFSSRGAALIALVLAVIAIIPLVRARV